MRKIIAFLAVLTLLLSLCACTSESNPTGEAPTTGTTEAPESSEGLPSEPKTEPTTEPSETTEATTEPPVDEDYQLGAVAARTYRDNNGTIWAMSFAEIINTGDSPIYLGEGVFTLKDAQGSSVKTLESVSAYPQIVLPECSGYYYEVTELDLPDTQELSLSAQVSVSRTDIAPDSYNIAEYRLTDSRYGGLELRGTVQNTSGADGELVCIAALLLDPDGQLLGILSTVLPDALRAGEEIDFSTDSNMGGFVLPDALKAADVASTLIYAYPLLDGGVQ